MTTFTTKRRTRKVVGKTKEDMFLHFAELCQIETKAKEKRKAYGELLLKKHGEQTMLLDCGEVYVSKKEKLTITSKAALIRHVTQISFNKLAKFSKRKIIKELGQQGMQKLIDLGIIEFSPLSTIYKFKKTKCD